MATNDYYEYVLVRGGEIKKRRIIEQNIEITDRITQALTSQAKFKVNECFMLEDKSVSVNVFNSGITYYSLTLDSLVLNTSFRANDKILVPVFSGNDNIMSLPWPAQEGMTIRFTVCCMEDPATHKHCLNNAFLFVFDANKQCYKLPVANLYDDCRLCHGQSRKWFRTGADTVLETLRTFGQSRWNGDLWSSAEQTHALFKFAITSEGFNPIPVKDWAKYCLKVGTAISELSL